MTQEAPEQGADPYNDPNKASLELVLAPPSPAHPLGADSSGFDILSRLLVATQVTSALAASSTRSPGFAA